MVSFRKRRHNKVLLHLQDGPSLEGVLRGRTDGHYVLWAPKVVGEEDATVAVSGHVEVPESRVLFFQVIG